MNCDAGGREYWYESAVRRRVLVDYIAKSQSESEDLLVHRHRRGMQQLALSYQQRISKMSILSSYRKQPTCKKHTAQP